MELTLSSPWCLQEACQAAGPVQGHGERSPEGGAVGEEDAEEQVEIRKDRKYFMNFLFIVDDCVHPPK